MLPGDSNLVSYGFQIVFKWENSEYVKIFQPIGLMDGGIVDNQGLEYVEHAEKQLECNDPGQNSKYDRSGLSPT